jgi:hypothetical protein
VRESIQLNPSSGKDRVQDVPVPGTVGEMIGDDTSPKDETAVDALCDFGLSVARRQQMWDSCPAFRQKVPSPEVLKVRTDSTRFINAGWFDHYFDDAPLDVAKENFMEQFTYCVLDKFDKSTRIVRFTAAEFMERLPARLFDIWEHNNEGILIQENQENLIVLCLRLYIDLRHSFEDGLICWENLQIFYEYMFNYLHGCPGFSFILGLRRTQGRARRRGEHHCLRVLAGGLYRSQPARFVGTSARASRISFPQTLAVKTSIGRGQRWCGGN